MLTPNAGTTSVTHAGGRSTSGYNTSPRSIRVTTAGNNRPKDAAFDLTLALSQVETNVPLGDDVFRIEIPPSAVPITVDELRRARLGLREN